MKRTFIIFITFLLLPESVFAQNKYNPIKWVLRPSFGYTIGITNPTFGYITDNLTTLTKNSHYWQFISAAWFFSDWGIELDIAGSDSKYLDLRAQRFSDEVIDRFSPQYFTTVGSGAQYPAVDPSSGSILRGSVGPVYKIEKYRALFIFRGLIGTTGISTDWGSAILKEKGTNTILDADWSAADVSKDLLTFNPSFTLGYRFTKRLSIDFDINYWLYVIDFKYVETINNLVTGESVITNYQYKKAAKELSFGLGLMIILK